MVRTEPPNLLNDRVYLGHREHQHREGSWENRGLVLGIPIPQQLD
jgi:hypothetical protein